MLIRRVRRAKAVNTSEKTGQVPILHPFLFSINFVLYFFTKNRDLVPLNDFIRPFVVVLIFSVVLIFVIRSITKDWYRAGVLSTLFIVLILYFGTFHRFIFINVDKGFTFSYRLMFFLLFCLLVYILGSNHFWRILILHKYILTNFLNIVAIVVVIIPTYVLIRLPTYASNNKQALEIQNPGSNVSNRILNDNLPDIYYIVVDGYTGDDILQDVFGLDNSDFYRFLDVNGFFIAEDSKSNYIQTSLSLASSLNMQYLDKYSYLTPESNNREALDDLIRKSRVRDFLEENGYKIITLESGYSSTDIIDSDLFLTRYWRGLNPFESFLLSMTPMQFLVEVFDLNIPLPTYRTHRERVLYIFDALAELHEIPSPKFIFAHIIAPHPPFVFDREGNAKEPNRPYFIGDGDAFYGEIEEYLHGYPEELIFINSLLENTITTILEKSAPPPIIILQADHGSGALLDFQSVDNSCLSERLSILNAYYLPGNKMDKLYSTVTPVNSFRIVFDTYFSSNLGLLKDRSYFSTWDRPYDFIDVSDKTDTSCQLPSALIR